MAILCRAIKNDACRCESVHVKRIGCGRADAGRNDQATAAATVVVTTTLAALANASFPGTPCVAAGPGLGAAAGTVWESTKRATAMSPTRCRRSFARHR